MENNDTMKDIEFVNRVKGQIAMVWLAINMGNDKGIPPEEWMRMMHCTRVGSCGDCLLRNMAGIGHPDEMEVGTGGKCPGTHGECRDMVMEYLMKNVENGRLLNDCLIDKSYDDFIRTCRFGYESHEVK